MGYQLQKMKYSHEAMADLIIANPSIKQREIAQTFDMTEGWISQVINSDTFRAFFAKRKGDLVDPLVVASIEEQLDASMRTSLGILQAELEDPTKVKGKTELAMKMLEMGQRAKGYGARPGAQVQVNTFVAVVPAKAVSGEDWLEQTGRPAQAPITVDADTIIIEG
jgi:hypothetical protein